MSKLWKVYLERSATDVHAFPAETGHRAFDRAHALAELHGCLFVQSDEHQTLTVKAEAYYRRAETVHQATPGRTIYTAAGRVTVPALKLDAMMLERHGQEVSATGKIERQIVAGLAHHLGKAGWTVSMVYDGEQDCRATSIQAAMELIFNLDDAWVWFSKGTGKARESHSVRLVLGNGVDVVSDWTYTEGDASGFSAEMDAFDSEVYA